MAAGPLDEGRAERTRAWTRKLTGGLQGKVDRRTESTSYMVYVPASRTQADAQRRFDQLRQSGLTDIFLLTEGSLRLAISLGIFRTQEGARAQIETLGGRGIDSLRIASIPGRSDRVWATLTRTASVADGPWDAARAQLKDLAGVTPAACTP